jgi:hypothetical protein
MNIHLTPETVHLTPSRVLRSNMLGVRCEVAATLNAVYPQALVHAILAGSNSSTYDLNKDNAVNAVDAHYLANVVLGVNICN